MKINEKSLISLITTKTSNSKGIHDLIYYYYYLSPNKLIYIKKIIKLSKLYSVYQYYTLLHHIPILKNINTYYNIQFSMFYLLQELIYL